MLPSDADPKLADLSLAEPTICAESAAQSMALVSSAWLTLVRRTKLFLRNQGHQLIHSKSQSQEARITLRIQPSNTKTSERTPTKRGTSKNELATPFRPHHDSEQYPSSDRGRIRHGEITPADRQQRVLRLKGVHRHRPANKERSVSFQFHPPPARPRVFLRWGTRLEHEGGSMEYAWDCWMDSDGRGSTGALVVPSAALNGSSFLPLVSFPHFIDSLSQLYLESRSRSSLVEWGYQRRMSPKSPSA